jgi:hypothetical protein
MRVGTIYYSETTDTTEIKWNDDFVVTDRITKLDVLKDMRGITWLAYDYAHEFHDNNNGDGYLPESIEG